jgi:F-type H+-transporting ATPase subunit epsilon
VAGATRVLGGRLTVRIVTPEQVVYEGPADLVVVPSHDGETAFLPGHAPFVGLLGAGELRFHVPDGGLRRYFLAGGVAQVVEDVVTVLAETAALAEHVDVAQAEADLEKARALRATSDEEVAARDKAVASARARLRVAARGTSGAHAIGTTGPHAG